jgi:hypothetical protein
MGLVRDLIEEIALEKLAESELSRRLYDLEIEKLAAEYLEKVALPFKPAAAPVSAAAAAGAKKLKSTLERVRGMARHGVEHKSVVYGGDARLQKLMQRHGEKIRAAGRPEKPAAKRLLEKHKAVLETLQGTHGSRWGGSSDWYRR